MFCPHCKSTHVETTCLALQNGEDINECICHKCKRRGIVRDWVLLRASQSKIDGASANTASLPRCPDHKRMARCVWDRTCICGTLPCDRIARQA
jgi:hypothetical protein